MYSSNLCQRKMGNFSSTESCSSPVKGIDALKALLSSFDPGPNSSNKNEDVFSADSFSLEDQDLNSRDALFGGSLRGQIENPDELNLMNLQASFLASLLPTQVQPSYDVLSSQRFSLNCIEFVTMCASFIPSTLKIFGPCVPQDNSLINDKCYMMTHTLDNLHQFLSKMKFSHWNLEQGLERESACRNCDIKQILFRHVNLRDSNKSASFCLVCLMFLPKEEVTSHIMAVGHKRLKENLLAEIYPHRCHKCLLRFCEESDLYLHLSQRDSDSDVSCEKEEFNPFCCYLCQTAFGNMTDLEEHIKTSIEHGLKKEIAMEVNLRNKMASQECTARDVSCTSKIDSKLEVLLGDCNDATVEPESSQQYSTVIKTAGKNSELEETMIETEQLNEKRDPLLILPCVECSFSDAALNLGPSDYFCEICQRTVPKVNDEEHVDSERHVEQLEALVCFERKMKERESKYDCDMNAVMQALESLDINKKVNPVAIGVTTDDAEKVPTADPQLQVIKELILFHKNFLESIDVNGVGARYRCTLCCTGVGENLYTPGDKMALHLLSLRHILNWSKTQSLQMMEEKFNFLIRLRSYNVFQKLLVKAALRIEDVIRRRRETCMNELPHKLTIGFEKRKEEMTQSINELSGNKISTEVCKKIEHVREDDVLDLSVSSESNNSIPLNQISESGLEEILQTSNTIGCDSMERKNNADEFSQADKFSSSNTIWDKVMKKVLNLEHNFINHVVSKKFTFWCSLCSVESYCVPMFFHLLSKRHLNEQWASSQTAEIMEEKLKILMSLQTHNVFQSCISKAISRIEVLLKKKRNETGSQRKLPAELQDEHATELNRSVQSDEVNERDCKENCDLFAGGADQEPSSVGNCDMATDITLNEEYKRQVAVEMLMLERDFITRIEWDDTKVWCSLCSFESTEESMILHALGESHFNQLWTKMQRTHLIEEKLESLKYFQTLNVFQTPISEAILRLENLIQERKKAWKCPVSAEELIYRVLLDLEEDYITPRHLDGAVRYWCSLCNVEFDDMVDHVLRDKNHRTLWFRKQTLQNVEERLTQLQSLKSHQAYKKSIRRSVTIIKSLIRKEGIIAMKANELKYEDNKKIVTEKVLLLEKNFLTISHIEGLGCRCWCSLCSVECDDITMTLHVLSDEHLSPLWGESQALHEIQEKLNYLTSLQTYNAYQIYITAALERMKYLIQLKEPLLNADILEVKDSVNKVCDAKSENFVRELFLCEEKFLKCHVEKGFLRYQCILCNLCPVTTLTRVNMAVHLVSRPHLKKLLRVLDLEALQEKLRTLASLQTYNVFSKKISEIICKVQTKIRQQIKKGVANAGILMSMSDEEYSEEGTVSTNMPIEQKRTAVNLYVEQNKDTSVFPSVSAVCERETKPAKFNLSSRADLQVKKSDEISDPATVVQKILILEETHISCLEDGNGKYICSLCSLTCQDTVMVYHVLGEKHLSDNWFKNHSFETMERKLEALRYLHLQSLQMMESKVEAYFQTFNALEGFIKKAISRIENFVYLKGKKMSMEEKLPQRKNPSEEKVNESYGLEHAEDSVSRDVIVIGDPSAGSSLQDEFLQACGGWDGDEFDVECGVCGALFPIYNGDIDFSLDMHAQNDPQHSLATAVPVERDAQQMSETSKMETSFMTKPIKKSSVHHKLITKKNYTAHNKQEVLKVILQLENRYISRKSNGYYCNLCSLTLRTDCSVVHHCLKPVHMSWKWASDHTTAMLQEKYEKIESLKELKYASSIIEMTLIRLALLMSPQKNAKNKKNPQSESSVPLAPKVKVTTRVFVPSSTVQADSLCGICLKDYAKMTKVQKRRHNCLCKTRDPSELYFCDICDSVMDVNSTSSHLNGKKHIRMLQLKT